MVGPIEHAGLRREAARLLRRVAAGVLPILEYEARILRLANEPGAPGIVEASFLECGWLLYDDVWTPVALRGRHRLDRTGRHLVARWVLLLRSTQDRWNAEAPRSHWPFVDAVALQAAAIEVCGRPLRDRPRVG